MNPIAGLEVSNSVTERTEKRKGASIAAGSDPFLNKVVLDHVVKS